MGERLPALRRVLFLKTLPDDALAALAREGREKTLGAGETLFAERDRCLGLVVVLAGAVRVYKLDSRGRELTLDRELTGESVAELGLFDGGNYAAHAEAAEDGTRVLIVPSERFHALIAAYPDVARRALLAMGVRLRRMIAMAEAQALHPVRGRLCAYLLRRAEGRATFHLTETNAEIAGQLGTVREVVSRTLRALAEDGTIRLIGRAVTIPDADRLCRLAGTPPD